MFFHLQFNNKFKNCYFISKQVICFILNILNCYQYTTLIRLAIPDNFSDFEGNPIMYFKFFHRSASIMYKYVAIKSFWFDWKSFLDILNFLLNCNRPCLKSRKMVSQNSSTFVWLNYKNVT